MVFQVVNPVINGKFNTTIKKSSATDAAKHFWGKFTEHVSGNIPSFGFTLRNRDSGKLYHFAVKEELLEGGEVDTSINRIDPKLSKQEEKAINMNFDEMSGGKKRKSKRKSKKRSRKYSDSSSDTSSIDSSEYNYLKSKYVHLSQPILSLRYLPDVYKFKSVYVPNFVSPLSPFFEYVATYKFLESLGKSGDKKLD